MEPPNPAFEDSVSSSSLPLKIQIAGISLGGMTNNTFQYVIEFPKCNSTCSPMPIVGSSLQCQLFDWSVQVCAQKDPEPYWCSAFNQARGYETSVESERAIFLFRIFKLGTVHLVLVEVPHFVCLHLLENRTFELLEGHCNCSERRTPWPGTWPWCFSWEPGTWCKLEHEGVMTIHEYPHKE